VTGSLQISPSLKCQSSASALEAPLWALAAPLRIDRKEGKGRKDLNGRDTQLTAKSRSACWTTSLRFRCHRRATAPDRAQAITAGHSNPLWRRPRPRLRVTVSVTAWAAERRSHVLPVGMKAAKICRQPIEQAVGSAVPSCVAQSPEGIYARVVPEPSTLSEGKPRARGNRRRNPIPGETGGLIFTKGRPKDPWEYGGGSPISRSRHCRRLSLISRPPLKKPACLKFRRPGPKIPARLSEKFRPAKTGGGPAQNPGRP